MGIQTVFDLIHHFYMDSFNKETFILSSKRANKCIFARSMGDHNKNTVFLTRQTLSSVLLADIWRNKKKFVIVFLNQTKYFLSGVLMAHYFNIPWLPKKDAKVSDVNRRFIVCQLSICIILLSNTRRPYISWGKNTLTSPYA